MRRIREPLLVGLIVTLGIPLLIAHPVLAANGSVAQVENFLRSVIKVVSGLAGLVATGFFVLGGLQYITSSGSPERMDRAKHTLIHAAVGLAIVFGAFVVANIVTGLAAGAFGS